MKRFFTIIPADVIADRNGPYRGQSLAMWQWFVQRIAESPKVNGRRRYEFINGTSSINNSEPYPIECAEGYWNESRRRVVNLLLHAGQKCPMGLFLRRCGIGSWGALNKPLRISIPTHDEFPDCSWFDMAGRTFIKSPNSHHASAKSVFKSQLKLSNCGTLWSFSITYGYPHDSSEWHFLVDQNRGESLPTFVERVNRAVLENLTPEEDGRFRKYKESQWNRVHESLRGVFYDPAIHMPNWENELSNKITTIDGTSLSDSRIKLNKSRLAVLKRWAEAKR